MQLDVVPKERVVQDSAACTNTFYVYFQMLMTTDLDSPSCIQAPCKAPCYRLGPAGVITYVRENVL